MKKHYLSATFDITLFIFACLATFNDTLAMLAGNVVAEVVFWIFWAMYALYITVTLLAIKISYQPKYNPLRERFAEELNARSNFRKLYNTAYDAIISLLLALNGYFILGFIWFTVSEFSKRRLTAAQELDVA